MFHEGGDFLISINSCKKSFPAIFTGKNPPGANFYR